MLVEELAASVALATVAARGSAAEDGLPDGVALAIVSSDGSRICILPAFAS
jgi:hypothetical protein